MSAASKAMSAGSKAAADIPVDVVGDGAEALALVACRCPH